MRGNAGGGRGSGQDAAGIGQNIGGTAEDTDLREAQQAR